MPFVLAYFSNLNRGRMVSRRDNIKEQQGVASDVSLVQKSLRQHKVEKIAVRMKSKPKIVNM